MVWQTKLTSRFEGCELVMEIPEIYAKGNATAKIYNIGRSDLIGVINGWGAAYVCSPHTAFRGHDIAKALAKLRRRQRPKLVEIE